MAWPTSVATITSGQTSGVAAALATYRDALKAIGDPEQSYTPVWTGASTNPAIGNGTLTGNYISAGKLTIGRIVMTTGTTTTYGSGAWAFTLPTTPITALGRAAFDGLVHPTSGGDYPIRGVVVGGVASIAPRGYNTTAGGVLVAVSSTVPFSWAASTAGQICQLDFVYEAA